MEVTVQNLGQGGQERSRNEGVSGAATPSVAAKVRDGRDSAHCKTPERGLRKGRKRVEVSRRMERREIYYSGRVQGVGFRYTTLQIAAGFQVTGYVENLADGRVHLVVEGPPEELERFTRAVSARLRHHIRTAEEARGPATGSFTGFTIRG